MEETLAVVTMVVIGSMVGVELAVAAVLNPIFDRLPNNGGVAARSDGARLLGRVMPFWYIGSILLAAGWVIRESAVQGWGQPRTLVIASAAALLVLSVGMSIILLVPVNSRIAQWSRAGAPEDWRQQVSRWDRLHYLRVGVIVTAFALLAVAGVTG